MNTVKYLLSLIVLLVGKSSCPAADDLVVFIAISAVTLVYMMTPPYETYHFLIKKLKDQNKS